MNSGTARLTGLAGLAWGVLVLVAYLGIFVFAGRAATGGGTGGAGVVVVLGLLALVAMIAMLYFLSTQLSSQIGKIACYAGLVFAILLIVFQFAQPGGAAIPLVASVLLGISCIVIGVFGVMQGGAGAWKAFAILLIVAGALKTIVIGEIIYPFVACAAGIVLFVAMNAAAKRPA
jgi:hypothetical protein